MTMALQVFTDTMALLWQHPLLSGLVLVFFTPPFFPIVKFFSPLLISTALFMLALFTVGGPETLTTTAAANLEDSAEFRRAPEVKVWEDKSLFTKLKRRGPDSTWLDSLQAVTESASSWLERKLQNENWKGKSLNDDNVSILQEATWTREPSIVQPETDVSTDEILNAQVPASIAPSRLFKVDSTLKASLVSQALESDAARVSKQASTVQHEPLKSLEIPAVANREVDESPSTDLGDSTDLGKRFLRRNSVNATSITSESDVDTPATVALSKSGRLKQIETLGDLLEEKELHHEITPEHEALLKATTTELVEAVKERLEGFTHSPEREVLGSSSGSGSSPAKKKNSSPLFKQGEKPAGKVSAKGAGKGVGKAKRKLLSDDDGESSSGVEEFSDSESDSEFEIFPPVDNAKMKLHPPVKLDITELERKLGTSLSRAATPPKNKAGEITEVQ